MGNTDARHFEVLQSLVDAPLAVEIQVRGALIQKKDPGLVIKRAREQHPLLLSA